MVDPHRTSTPSAHSSALYWRWLVWLVPAVVLFHVSPFRRTLERAYFDWACRHPLRAPATPQNSAIVLIDEATLAKAGELDGMRWPFPRWAFAGMIAALDRAGAAKIILDFNFFEPSDRADFDGVLAGVAAAVPSVVLGGTGNRGPVFWNQAFVSAHPAFFQRGRVGGTLFNADEDGTCRNYRVSGSLAALASDAPVSDRSRLLRWHGGLSTLRAHAEVPILSAAPFIIRGKEIIWRVMAVAPDLNPTEMGAAIAAEPQLAGVPAFESVRGRAVFVGANAAGTFDTKATPVGKMEPGVLVHWTAWANLTSSGFIAALPPAVPLLAAVVASLLVVLPGVRWPGIAIAGIAAPAVIVTLLALSYAGLSSGWFLAPVTPAFAAAVAFVGVAAESFLTERRRKREIQAMFGSYLDPAVVALLVRDPTAIRLGGERREATVYFSDLAGFTDLSERVRPEELVGIINLYLQEMSDCLMQHGAYVDKYIGDAVMAVFGAPRPAADHAAAACRAALAAIGVLDGINRRLAATHGRTLSMRIGINTGDMIVGNLGSERKRNYTVLGDAVNLASRLEAANKEFGTTILLGENTARAVSTEFATRPLTRLRVKGKAEAVEVHELVAARAGLSSEWASFLQNYREGYDRFQTREFGAAAQALRRASEFAPADRVTTELLRQAEAFTHTPPAADWEPVLNLHTK